MANRRTTVGLDSYILTTDALKGASLFATATGRNFVGDKTAQDAHIVDTDTDLQWELSTAGTYVYDARTNDVWKYTTGWAKDTSGTFKLSLGRLYSNPLTRKAFFVETPTRVLTVTLGVKELMSPPPLPDFWAPLSSSLALTTGQAPYDTNTQSRSLTFTRASTATYVDKSGIVRTAGVNEPRFEAPGLLFEGASTNLILNSSDFTNAYWSRTRIGITGGFAAPDGSTTACKIVPDATNGPHYFNRSVNMAVGWYTWSAFVKAGEMTKCRVNVTDGSVIYGSASINLNSGSIISSTPEAVTVQSLANGWYRVAARFQVTTAINLYCNVWVEDESRNTTYTGDGTSGLYVWGAQLEALPIPSSYIPTTTAAATRAKDVATMSVDNWGPTMSVPFTLAMDVNRSWNILPQDAPRVFRVLTNNLATELSLGWGSAIGLRAGVGASNITAPLPLGQSTVGMRMQGNYTSAFVGPTIMTSSYPLTTTDIPQQIILGDIAYGATGTPRPMFGHIKNFRVWNRALTDEQIKGL